MSKGGKCYVHEKHYPHGKPVAKKVAPPVVSTEIMQRALDSIGRFQKRTADSIPGSSTPK
ncbi:MAG: hypothetical protein A2184_04715 [Candidatus Moranbacteria bacterium RIFOXYA1_FULL_44_7]|nr:MAG: hypothetical protein A2184_04715 [Candidatus Moranbacteria bacterium RIFOXYA1_FULL_44_7]